MQRGVSDIGLENGWGYVNRSRSSVMTARVGGTVYDRMEGPCRYGTAGDRGRNNESAVGKTGGAALSVRRHAVLRRERADRERWLEALAVAVLTVLSERDGAVRGTERRAGDALQRMTAEEGVSLRSSGAAVALLRCGRCLGDANSRTTRRAAAADERPSLAPLAIRTAISRPPWSALRPRRSVFSWAAVGG